MIYELFNFKFEMGIAGPFLSHSPATLENLISFKDVQMILVPFHNGAE
jgi:hypothetical protein